ncbi:MAG: hypothetical protein JM58_15010 [Peptococcaceae bacterium BICA1-8]|nr:MAG: hypothetical protein JM58_15010 [Peptococcaceae bacterium BICA1-8]
MKLKKILWILPVILLIFISFISINPVYGEPNDSSITGETVIQVIEKTGLGYSLNKWAGNINEQNMKNEMEDGSVISLQNIDTIFDALHITYYKNGYDEKAFITVRNDLQQEVNIEGNRVVFQRGKTSLNPDGWYVNWAEWYSEPFKISLWVSDIRKNSKDNNNNEMLRIVPIITNALKQMAVGEEKTDQSQDYNIKFELEKNPLTGNVFKGIVADGTSSLSIKINIPDSYQGKIKIKAPKAGSFEGVKAEKEIKPSGDLSFNYIPPQYISHQTANKEKFISDEIAITYTLEDGSTKEIKESIQVYKPPVVLVHGFTGDKTTWQELDTYLQTRGFDTVREEYYYNDATGQSIPAQAHGLSRHIKDKITEYHSSNIKINKVDVVAHSMGGLISRHYISKLDNLYQDDIRKLIMVGTPNHGCDDLDKLIGLKISEDLNKHKKAAEQLYGKNPFILDLNKGESEGKHLNPDVQYGIIYGTGSPVGGDGVVSDISVLLNGVTAENLPGRTHSPAVSRWGTSLTLDNEVFEKTLNWLETDIPLGEFITYDMRIYSVEGEAYISNLDYTDESNYWRKLDASSTERIYNFDDIKTGDGRLVILLKAGSNIFGYVEMNQHTELYFDYVSPNIARVYLSKGSAKYVSNSQAGKHFETVLKASSNIQVVRGLNTQYVVSLDDKPTVFSLEGKIELINAASVDIINKEIIEEKNGAVFEDNGSFTPAEPGADPWWENEFYKPISFGNNILYIIFGSWADRFSQVSTIDIILLVIVAGGGLYGYMRGFISTLFSFLSYFLAITGAKLLAPKTASLLAYNTMLTKQIDGFIVNKLASFGIDVNVLNAELPKINQMITQDEGIRQAMSQNPLLMKLLSGQGSVISNHQNISAMLSNYILTALSMVLIFILLKIIISYLGKLLNNRVKLPIVSKVNKTLGLVLGILTGLMISTIGLLVVTPIALTSSNGTLAKIIDNSLIVEKLLQVISF